MIYAEQRAAMVKAWGLEAVTIDEAKIAVGDEPWSRAGRPTPGDIRRELADFSTRHPAAAARLAASLGLQL